MADALSGDSPIPPAQTTLPDVEMDEELERLRSENTALEAEIEELRGQLDESEEDEDRSPETLTPEGVDEESTRVNDGVTEAAGIAAEIEAASRRSLCSETQTWAVIEALAGQEDATAREIGSAVSTPFQHVWTLLLELRSCSCVERSSDGIYTLSPAARDLVLESANPLAP